jgi:hypothetical protein
MKLIAAAISIVLMGMAGVALAAPKSDPGPPPQAQGNGPAPQAQLGPPPQAQAPAPAAAKPKTTGQHGGGKQVQAPAVQAPAQSNPGSSVAPGHQGGHRGRPAPGEVRGRGQARANSRRATHCQAARCQGEASSNSGDEQPADGGVVLGVTDERPSRDRAGRKPGKPDPGPAPAPAPEWVSVQGLNQGGGGEVAYTPPESFDGALPFTGFELVLLAAIGTLLGLAGMWLRRLTA